MEMGGPAVDFGDLSLIREGDLARLATVSACRVAFALYHLVEKCIASVLLISWSDMLCPDMPHHRACAYPFEPALWIEKWQWDERANQAIHVLRFWNERIASVASYWSCDAGAVSRIRQRLRALSCVAPAYGTANAMAAAQQSRVFKNGIYVFFQLQRFQRPLEVLFV